MALQQIKAPVAKELSRFNKDFRQVMRSNIPLLNIVTKYILNKKGKQLRPLFVFLTAKMLGEINSSTYVGASLVEIMHTATLIHDDVVDESYERRGIFSINALWKSKIAVLVGDYLLAKGLLHSIENEQFSALGILSDAVRKMSEGELLQLQKTRKLNITEEEYFDIIEKKTAALIASCTAIGANSVITDNPVIEKMKLFGKYVGIAFQIRDDLFDYEKKNMLGKPVGNDIKEKKLTLPLIHAIQNSNNQKTKRIKRLINNGRNKHKDLQEVIEFVKEYDGIHYAYKRMHAFKDMALDLLNDISVSKAKESLIKLVDFTISREK